MIGALTGMMASVAPPSEPGLRMSGKYAGPSGLLLDFGGDAVTLDCRQAHVKQSYTVENAPAELLIHVHNSGGPLTLAVAARRHSSRLRQPTVNGRLVSGMQGDSVTFTPASSTCEVSTLGPATGSTPSVSVASSPAAADPAPAITHVASSAPASAAAPAPSAPASSVPAASAPAGSARLLITTAFPTGGNPLIGRNILLMKDSYDNVLRKVGAPIPPSTTPGKAMKSFAIACRPPADCKAANAAMAPYFVGRATVDSTGKAVVAPQLPPGSYFVSVAAPTTGAVLVWDVKVDLKPGDNSVTLDPHNAETVP